MNNHTDALHIVVAETSDIVRSGLAVILRRIPNLNAHPVEISSPEALRNYLHLHRPDIIAVNPTFGGWFDLAAFRAGHDKLKGVRYVAIVCTVTDTNVLREYDESLSILESAETIADKLHRLIESNEPETAQEAEQEPLSQREKEIITCVVKGMTNKAIAEQLFLSIHTVITHRRNIARKLQIHSPAGLTIYAIVNKLVELKDIKGQL